MRTMLLLPTLLLLGCPGSSDDKDDTGDTSDTGDTAETGDTGETDETGETGDTSDTSETGDTGETAEERFALKGKLGEASVDEATYRGWEDLYWISEDGDGVDVCRVRMLLSETGVRSDCDVCDWAFDLVVDSASITAESDVGCVGTLGLDKAGVAGLAGTTMSYGYVADYYGHAQVLMANDGAGWAAVSFAAVENDLFTYDWEDGLVPY